MEENRGRRPGSAARVIRLSRWSARRAGAAPWAPWRWALRPRSMAPAPADVVLFLDSAGVAEVNLQALIDQRPFHLHACASSGRTRPARRAPRSAPPSAPSATSDARRPRPSRAGLYPNPTSGFSLRRRSPGRPRANVGVPPSPSTPATGTCTWRLGTHLLELYGPQRHSPRSQPRRLLQRTSGRRRPWSPCDRQQGVRPPGEGERQSGPRLRLGATSCSSRAPASRAVATTGRWPGLQNTLERRPPGLPPTTAACSQRSSSRMGASTAGGLPRLQARARRRDGPAGSTASSPIPLISEEGPATSRATPGHSAAATPASGSARPASTRGKTPTRPKKRPKRPSGRSKSKIKAKPKPEPPPAAEVPDAAERRTPRAVRRHAGPAAAARHLVNRFSYGITPGLTCEVTAAGGHLAWFDQQLERRPRTDPYDAWWPDLTLDARTMYQRQVDKVTRHAGRSPTTSAAGRRCAGSPRPTRCWR